MTAIAAVILDSGRAVVWADTLTFVESQPSGHECKLMVNPTALLAGTGTGWSSLMKEAGTAITNALNLDELLTTLPGHLRQRAAILAERRRDPATFLENIVVIAGWTEKYRRMIVYRFAAEDFFQPTMQATFASPIIPEIAAIGAQSLDDLQGIAVEQIERLNRSFECKIGGKIIAATITPHGIATRTLVNLDQEVGSVGTGETRPVAALKLVEAA